MSKLDNIIIEGVKYRKGSVKVIEAEGRFTVVVKRYFLLKLISTKKEHNFNTLEEAMGLYDQMKTYLYRIS